MTDGSKGKFTCNEQEPEFLKVLEGMEIDCGVGYGQVVRLHTKCEVTCESGGPNYKEVTCKEKGWRPTKEVRCEGVNAGVIVGVLIGTIFAIVIIAVLVAKYRQRQKKKSGIVVKVQTGKSVGNVSSRRPGKPAPTIDIQTEEPNKSDHHKQGWKASSKKSNPPSYNEVEGRQTERPEPAKRSAKTRSNNQSSNDKRSKSDRSKSNYSSTQYGYDSGYQAYPYESTQYMPQVGYHNQSYYQGQVGYGYPAQDPAVGYLNHPQTYPQNRDQSRPYNVQT